MNLDNKKHKILYFFIDFKQEICPDETLMQAGTIWNGRAWVLFLN